MENINIPEWTAESPTYSLTDFDFETFQDTLLQDAILGWELAKAPELPQPSASGPTGDSQTVRPDNLSTSPPPFSPIPCQEQNYLTEAMPLVLPTSYEKPLNEHEDLLNKYQDLLNSRQELSNNHQELLNRYQEAQQTMTRLLREISVLTAGTEPEIGLEDDSKTIEAQNLMPRKKVPKNSRPMNILAFKPKMCYSPPPPRAPWTTPNGYTFHYTKDGELDPQLAFTPAEIFDFLYSHPEHGKFGGHPPKHSGSGLTIWIQHVPADAVNRYPTRLSSKCRFETCPIPGRTIKNGEFRVCLDECDNWFQQVYPNLQKDPYHNAGYVHLFCLEKELDFASLCKTFNVRGDTRRFLAERNKMAITRDHESLLDIANEYIQNSAPRVGLRPANWYDHSLSLALTREHLFREPNMRQGVRDGRNGNSIDRHLNNLDVMRQRAVEIRQRKLAIKQRCQTSSVPKASMKRKAGEIDEDGEFNPGSKWDEQNRLFKRSRNNIGLW